MLVSVVIPTCNRGTYIRETIESVLSQSYSSIEIIIVDDSSIDNTQDVISKLISEHPGKITLLKNERKNGVSGARNTGLQQAKGKYIAFLDDDDLWDRDKLKTQVGVLEGTHNIAALFSDVSFFGEVKEGYGKASYRKELFSSKFWNASGGSTLIAKGNIISFLLQNGSPFRIQTFIFRRDCLDKVGLFNQDMKYYEDAEFLLRFFYSFKVGYIRRPLCKVRRHKNNVDNFIELQEKYESEIKLLEGLANYNEANGRTWGKRLLSEALANAHVRMATFAFRRNGFNEARESLMKSLKVRLTSKAALRLSLLEIVPDFILKKLAKLTFRKDEKMSQFRKTLSLCKIMYVDGSVEFGGAAVSLLNMLRFLNKDKYEPFVVCLFPGRHVGVLQNEFKKIEVLRSGFKSSKKTMKVFHLFNIIHTRISHAVQLFFDIKRKKIRLVHFNNGVYYPGVIAAKIAGVPCIAHIRSLPDKLTVFTKFFGRFIDCFIPISMAVKRSYESQGFIFENVAKINDGIDIEGVKRKASSRSFNKEIKMLNGEFIIGAISRLSREKGINFLIEALPSILREESRAKCVIVGEGPLLGNLKYKVKDLGLAAKVVFTGSLDNPFSALSRFNVLVVPSIKEGLSLAVMEAMILGVPVVATRIGGMIELIEDRVDGLLVNPADADDISRSVLSLLNNESLRFKIRNNALRKANAEFSMKNAIETIEDKYREVLY